MKGPRHTKTKMGNNSIEQLLKLVDWNRQALSPYVVVDPMDPNGLLYLQDRDYQILLRTALRSNDRLVVVCRPGSKPSTAAGAGDDSRL